MNITEATSVLTQAAENLTAYRNGKLFEHQLVLTPCFDQLNPALDCVWQVALTSPLYQRMPSWVPLERQVKTALCLLKAIQHQIATGTIEFGSLYDPGYIEDLMKTSQLFKSIAVSITASAQTDYPDLDGAALNQLVAALQAAIDLLEVTQSLFGH